MQSESLQSEQDRTERVPRTLAYQALVPLLMAFDRTDAFAMRPGMRLEGVSSVGSRLGSQHAAPQTHSWYQESDQNRRTRIVPMRIAKVGPSSRLESGPEMRLPQDGRAQRKIDIAPRNWWPDEWRKKTHWTKGSTNTGHRLEELAAKVGQTGPEDLAAKAGGKSLKDSVRPSDGIGS